MKLSLLQRALKSSDGVEILLRNIMIVSFLTWNVVEGSVFQNEYPYAFVRLYTVPIWRLLLLILTITGAIWNHSLGIMLAFSIFFYVMDMEVTMDKWK
jgi:hypothetical protein